MKKIVAIFCLLALCLPLCACSSSSLESAEPKPAQTATADEKETKAPAKLEKFDMEKDLPENFSVGFGRVDISGPLPVGIWEGEATKVRDPLYLTCIAVSDGENVALLMSADAMGIQLSVYNQCAKKVMQEYGIPAENLLINVTHSHSAPSIGSNDRWLKSFYEKFDDAVEQALHDLAPAKAYAGKGYTDSLNFVRRYLMPDGSWVTNAGSTAVAHESEADNEVRTLRFEREGKKDILMTNYQSHYMGGAGEENLSADIFGEFRKESEKELDVLFVYFSGSSGNLNFNSAIPGERKYFNWNEGAKEFVRAVKVALEGEAEVATGKIVAKASVYQAKVKQDDPERIKHAEEIAATTDEKLKAEKIRLYGFLSKYEASAVVTRASLGPTKDLHFFAVSFGDVAFSTAPFEQFDTNGQEVRAASPFKMTFTLSMTNESNNYVPSALAEEHYSYEVSTCRFEKGSGTAFANEQIRLLGECKSAY
ncbi:MAG: hypothetical protein E7580_01415 [Ruminococcaceae bacterium]|nr:hypothetical protein [Oscillospiraceae bacterium]